MPHPFRQCQHFLTGGAVQEHQHGSLTCGIADLPEALLRQTWEEAYLKGAVEAQIGAEGPCDDDALHSFGGQSGLFEKQFYAGSYGAFRKLDSAFAPDADFYIIKIY